MCVTIQSFIIHLLFYSYLNHPTHGITTLPMLQTTEPNTHQIIYYSLPPFTTIKGLIILLHGCSHGGYDWKYLPIEKTIVTTSINKGLIPIALTSFDRYHKCWTEADISRVASAITYMKHFLSIKDIPIYLLGASSGGSFAYRYARQMKNNISVKPSAICVQISAPRHVGDNDVPVMFVHMIRDSYTAQLVQRAITTLSTYEVPAAELVCNPISLLNGLLFYNHGALDREDSIKLTSALQAAGMLSSKGYLADNPRESEWREVARQALPHIVPASDSLTADASPISEVLNMAWGEHEITDEHIDAALDWMLKYT